MLDKDKLLKEDTTHIAKKVNQRKKKKKIEIDPKQFLYTCIIGLIVMYSGIYTLYYVFVVPFEEVVKKTEVTSLIDEAEKLVNYVPYFMGEEKVYSNGSATKYTNLKLDFILAFLLTEVDPGDYSVNNTCGGKICFSVPTSLIVTRYYEYYGKIITEIPTNVTLSNGSCTIVEEEYQCILNSQNYSGKVSTIEAVKEDEEYLYVYETALFVDEAVIKGEYISFDYVALRPSTYTTIETDVRTHTSIDNINDAVMDLFYKYAKVYEHKFLKDGKNYYWESTVYTTNLPS
ncbi:MAG: hypothetical protein R3Y13_03925 [bacterium]